MPYVISTSYVRTRTDMDDRPEHYTCKICEKKGHWIQECPEKEERDAARGSDRTDIRKPLQRQSLILPSLLQIDESFVQSGRMLVLLVESESDKTSHRLDWIRDVSHAAERTTSAYVGRRSNGRFSRSRRWTRSHHSRLSFLQSHAKQRLIGRGMIDRSLSDITFYSERCRWTDCG